MPRAPSARIQARRERAAHSNAKILRGEVAQPNRVGQGNRRNPVPAPARANCRQEEEEVLQELIDEEGANYDDEELDEDYVAEEEEESEEVEMEPEDEEQELPDPPMNDLVAVMAQQTRLLQALVQDRQGRRENVRGPEARLSEFMKFRSPTFDHVEDPLEADDWLREINKKLDIIHARGRDRVLLAAHQLIGTSGEWWDNYNNASENPKNITWDEF